MKARSLESLVLKHFDFLRQNQGFKYDTSLKCYSKDRLKIKVQHENGKLNLMFLTDKKSINFVDLMSQIGAKKFTYPEYFLPWVLSMGDVESRLAYDAKLIKEHIRELFAIWR